MHEKQRNGNVQLPCSSGPTAAATAADVADGGALSCMLHFLNSRCNNRQGRIGLAIGPEIKIIGVKIN